jgi:dihydrofolate reductase
MKAVVAMSLNRVIGANGTIPWHLPEDFKWFKRLTTGHFILMGRKTFDSLPKPLPNRTNIVLTRAPRKLSRDSKFLERCGCAPLVGHWAGRLRRGAYQLGFERIAERDVWLVRSLSKLVATLKAHPPGREVFVIGGAQIYAQLLPECSDVYLTQVFREVEGDTFFPPFEEAFELVDVPLRAAEFEVRHFRRKPLAAE